MTVEVLGTVAVAMVFVGIGRLAERIVQPQSSEIIAPVTWLIAGWGFASFGAALCATIGITLSWLAVVLGAAGIAGFLLAPFPRPLAYLGISWFLIAPLIVIAGTIPPTMFDEFAQWLPNTRFLVDHGRFPDVAHPNIWSFKPSYPPAIPIVGYSVQSLLGFGFDIGSKIFSILLAASFGLVLADSLGHRANKFIAIPVGVLFSIVANPFFDPRIALTAYADTPTGFVFAYLIFVCWRSLDQSNPIWVSRAIAATLLLVLLRDTNIVLVLGVAAGLVLTTKRGRQLSLIVSGSAFAAFILWRVYLAVAAMPPAIEPRAFADWQWAAPWVVFRSLVVDRLANNQWLGIFAIALFILIALLVIAILFNRSVFKPLNNLLILAGTAAGLWIAFLLFSYVAVFNDGEIVRAASAWRYMSQLGPAFILVGFCIFGNIFDKRFTGANGLSAMARGRVFIAVLCMMPSTLVLVTLSHWQIQNQYPATTAIHEVARGLKPIIGGELLTVVHPIEALGYSIVIDYDLHRPAGASAPITDIGLATPKGYLLDMTGVDARRCPRLMRWADPGWKSIVSSELLVGCNGEGTESDRTR